MSSASRKDSITAFTLPIEIVSLELSHPRSLPNSAHQRILPHYIRLSEIT